MKFLSAGSRRAALCAWTLVAACLEASAFERLRREDEPRADARYFERNQDTKVEYWVRPALPAELKDEAEPLRVLVGWTVAVDGSVQDAEAVAGDPRGYAAALEALRQWRFRPAMEEGKIVPRSLRMTLVLRPGKPTPMPAGSEPPYTYAPVPLVTPQDQEMEDPNYPRHLVRRAIFGEVELTLGVDEQGRVYAVDVGRAVHPDLLTPALETVSKWKLMPARRGRLPVRGEKGAVLSFKVVDSETNHTSHEAWLEQNGIRLLDAQAPEPRLYFDRTPEAVCFVDPVSPAELRAKNATGAATVDFSVDRTGAVVAATIQEASDEACGAALLAAVAAWQFKPFYHGGEAVWVDFRVRWEFAPPTEENTASENLAVLKPEAAFANPRKLDARLEPLLIVAAVLPPGEKTGGTAQIEFIVNQNGRACWPRIVKADSPAVGWAAATAVSRWYFVTPRVAQSPVNVRVVVPVEVTPAK